MVSDLTLMCLWSKDVHHVVVQDMHRSHTRAANISSHFASSGDVAALSIFDPRRVPCVDSDDLSCYEEDSVSTLLAHYSIDRSAEILDGE